MGADDHLVAIGNQHLEALGYRVLVRVRLAAHDLYSATVRDLLHFDDTIDLRQHSLSLGRPGLEELLHPRQTACDVDARDASRVESTHRELSTRLADALGRDDAHRLAHHYRGPRRERVAVTVAAHAPMGLAGHRRPDEYAVHARIAQRLAVRIDHRLVAVYQDLARLRVSCRGRGQTAGDALLERGRQRGVPVVLYPEARLRPAIVSRDGHLLGDIDQATGQIPAVRRPERRVGLSFPGSVGRDEVLEHAKPLAEVRLDRTVDDPSLRVGHQPPHAGHLLDLRDVALGPGGGHQVDAAVVAQISLDDVGEVVAGARPYLYGVSVPLVLCDKAVHVLLLEGGDVALGVADDDPLLRGHLDVVDRYRYARLGGVAEAKVLDGVQYLHGLLVAEQLVALGGDVLEGRLIEVEVPESQLGGEHFVEDNPSYGGVEPLGVSVLSDLAHLDERPRVEVTELVLQARVLEAGKPPAGSRRIFLHHRHVVAAQDHVLRRRHDGLTGARGKHVVGAHHDLVRFLHRPARQRNVDGHLVAVEVGVESRAHERVNLYGAPVDQARLEGLDAEPVQGRCAVEQHRSLLHHILEDVPDLRPGALGHALGALDIVGVALQRQPVHHERLEELQRHPAGQPALVHLEVRPHGDHRAATVVYSLTQQVLAEPALLASQQVRQGLELVVMATGYRPAAAAVVYQRIDRLLKHPLLVAHDDLRRLKLDQPLEPVVPVDHSPVEVVQVARREPASVKLYHRPQFGRQHGQNREHHPLRLVSARPKRLHDAKRLYGLLPALSRRGPDLLLQVVALPVEVQIREHVKNGLRSHAGAEHLTAELAYLAVPTFGQKQADAQLLQVRNLCVNLVPFLIKTIDLRRALALNSLFVLLELFIDLRNGCFDCLLVLLELLVDLCDGLLGDVLRLSARQLSRLELLDLCLRRLFHMTQLCLQLLDLCPGLLVQPVHLRLKLLGLRSGLLVQPVHPRLQALDRRLTQVIVDPGHQVLRKIDDLLEVSG